MTSAQIARDLARYGVTPRKTFTAKVALLETNRHFWRGAVDGDGWVGISRRSSGNRKNRDDPRICLCGSHDMLEQWSAFVCGITACKGSVVRAGASIWQCGAQGRHAVRVINALYSDCHVALPRKLNSAKKIIERFSSLRSEDIGYFWGSAI